MPTVTRRTLLARLRPRQRSPPAPLRPPRRRRLPAGQRLPGVYRYKIGTFELTALYDGIWYRPITRQIHPQRAVRRSGARASPTPLCRPTNWRRRSPRWSSIPAKNWCSSIPVPAARSRPRPVRPGEPHRRRHRFEGRVDVIVISHFHPDHINGIKDKDNGVVFPNAGRAVPAAEWSFDGVAPT